MNHHRGRFGQRGYWRLVDDDPNDKQGRVKTSPFASFAVANPSIFYEVDYPAICLLDILDILQYTMMNKRYIERPYKLCKIEPIGTVVDTVCLVIEGISIMHWTECSDQFSNTKNIFGHPFAEKSLKPHGSEGVIQDLSLLVISNRQKKFDVCCDRNVVYEVATNVNYRTTLRALFPIQEELVQWSPVQLPETDSFSRKRLLLSVWQLIYNKYPTPRITEAEQHVGYVFTNNLYEPVTARSPIFILNVEMRQANRNYLTIIRVVLVNESHEVVYDSYVQNDLNLILNYPEGKKFAEVQTELIKLLPPDAILAGPNLMRNMHHLKIMHPYIIDISIIYNLDGNRLSRPSLKKLMKLHFGHDIPKDVLRFTPVEDACCAMSLVQLKLRNSITYGNMVIYKKEQKGPLAYNIAPYVYHHTVVVATNDVGLYYAKYVDNMHLREPHSLDIRANQCEIKSYRHSEQVISTLVRSRAPNFKLGHIKVNVRDDDEANVKKIDNYIDKVWRSLSHSTFFMVYLLDTQSNGSLVLMNLRHVYDRV